MTAMHLCDKKLLYGNGKLYCKVCGMDLGFNATKKKRMKKTFYYCCEECADADEEN